MEMILFIGIQATGKSEFYKQNFYKTHMRINLDMLRTRHREKVFLKACIEAKQPFVVDNTNPTKEERVKYIELAKEAGFSVKAYYFQSEIEASISRNQQRSGKECLPVQALLATHRKMELPEWEEGFHELFYVSIGRENKFVVEAYRDEV